MAERPAETVEISNIDVPLTRLDRSSDLNGLTKSFDRIGQIEPIIVRPTVAGRYELVCGSRRLEAAKRLGWQNIQAKIMTLDDLQAASLTLAENLERESFTDYELGKLFDNFSQRFGMSYSQIAEISGRSKTFISQHVAMTRLFADGVFPKDGALLEILSSLTERQARVLMRVKNERERLLFAKIAIKEELSIKQLEKLVGRQQHDLSGSENTTGVSRSSDSMQLTSMSTIHKRENEFAKTDREQIRDRIEGFFACINDKNFQPFVDFRDENTFTLFDDFPPFSLLEGKEAITHCFDVIESTRGKLQFMYNDLRIKLFDSFAIATFYIVYGRNAPVRHKSRVSVVFRKMKGKWMIVHEHWSPTSTYEDPIESFEG